MVSLEAGSLGTVTSIAWRSRVTGNIPCNTMCTAVQIQEKTDFGTSRFVDMVVVLVDSVVDLKSTFLTSHIEVRLHVSFCFFICSATCIRNFWLVFSSHLE